MESSYFPAYGYFPPNALNTLSMSSYQSYILTFEHDLQDLFCCVNENRMQTFCSLSHVCLNILSITLLIPLPGDLNCETCAMTRGALIGFGMGGVYPILFAIPVNGGLASR